MSRIGRQPIVVPAGVKVTLQNGEITVEGPKGKLQWKYHPHMQVAFDGKKIVVTRPNDERENRALHGLTRALINNMIVGVTQGYEKRLKVEGVGFQFFEARDVVRHPLVQRIVTAYQAFEKGAAPPATGGEGS